MKAQIDRDEWERYLKQSSHTLKSARGDMEDGDYDWACFKAQQAAELILKGLLRASGKLATGHSVIKLVYEIASFDIVIPMEIEVCSKELDKVYIPARYPDAYAWGAPVDYYTEDDARESIKCAERVLNFALGVVNA